MGAIKPLLDKVSSDQMALLALKVVIDRACDCSNEDASLLANVFYAVGSAVERQIQLCWYEETNKPEYDRIVRKYWKPTTGTEQRYVVMRTLMNRTETIWDRWSRTQVSKVGQWLVTATIECTRWFEIKMRARQKKKVNFLEPSLLFYQMKEEVLRVADLFTPLSWPMVSEPNNWSALMKGGYYLNELMRGHDMVRRGDPEILAQGEIPVNFLNNLQKVQFRLDTETAEVAKWAWEKGLKIGKFLPPTFQLDMPNKPHEGADEETVQAYRREATTVQDEQKAVVKKCVRTRKEMEIIDIFLKLPVDVFYFAHSFDYRGRVYPLNSFLSPQNTDFGKSMLRFAIGAPVTDVAIKWLKRHLATTFGNGIDKKSWPDREAWVDSHINEIIAVALDPYSTVCYWEKADEPWQFRSACSEYYHCVIAKDKTLTDLPCGIDQSCSGIQYWAGATRDESAARLVNVLPGSIPQDAYAAVAKKAMEWVDENNPERVFPEHIKPHMSRSATKRVVMTLPYNSKDDSQRKYTNEALWEIKRALKEAGVDLELTAEDRKRVKEAVVWAMGKVFPQIMKAMKKLEIWAGNAIDNGRTKLVWVSPSGFVVSQRKEAVVIDLIKTKIMGQIVKTSLPGESLGPNKRKHQNCLSPNWIHSLDAATLHIAFETYDKPFSVIHDCCLARATDLDEISEMMRLAFIKVFSETDPLRDLCEALGADPDDMPEIGTLDVSQVLESPYYMA